MRGRRGRAHSSSSVSQGQNRMALRKQIQKDASDIPSVSQIEEDTQEDEAADDKDELSLSMLTTSTARGKRRRERVNKSKPKEMTEEEMMDLALRLSEREASMTALKLREEEEEMMKAIQESMVSQTQLYPPSQSQSILSDADASIGISSRRKLLYPNGRKPFDGDQVASETDYTPGEEKSGGQKEEEEPKNMNTIKKRLDGSPLMEMPDSNIRSQASPSSSSESVLVPLDSPQSSDSTQIEDCQLRKSPVFPLMTSRAQVCISRLSQDVLENCTASGFVLCSQDSCTQKSLPAQPQSPTFPKSPACVNNAILPETTPSLKHGVLSETDQGDDAETQLSPQYCKSPVFGRNAQSEDPQSAFRAESRGCENSGFIALSQESLTSTSCQPRSPVFNKDITVCKSPCFSETDQKQDTEQSRSCSKSPVFGRTGQKQNTASLAAELRDPNSGGNPPSCSSRGSERLRQDIDLDTSDEDRCNYIMVSPRPDDNEEELTEAWNSVERELTSDMTLHWSDEDGDVIPVDSPSPVFPEEKAVHQSCSQTASQKPPTAASPQTNCSLNPQKCHSASFANNQSSSIGQTSPGPPSSSASTCQQHLSSVAPAPSAEPLTGQTVHYYWGVPFCPRGLDPDSYTKVILAQMEVYEKSVKQAQRCLMKKAEWGEAILPQPEKSPSPESASESPQLHLPRRRVLRRRGNNPCEDTDTPTAEAEEEENDKKEEDREEKKDEEEEGKGGEQQPDSDDCTVCPETQLSDNDSTQDLMMDADAEAELQVKSPEPPEVQEIPQDEAPTMDKQHQEDDEEMDVDVETEDPEDRETDRNKPLCDAAEGQAVRPEDRTDPDVEEIQDGGSLQRSKSPELEPAAVPQSPESSVDCPICQRSFPVSEIEMHAAYCDGDIAVVDEVALKPRRKRARRAEVAPEETNHTSVTGKSGQKQEKCYICQKAVPLRDYGRHTELCIHRSGSKMAATGSLLSALDRTESRDSEAGPSGARAHPGEIIDLRNEEDEEDGVAAIRVSNSPIRSFTPISEVSDCLIDFRKQHRVKKPSQRRR